VMADVKAAWSGLAFKCGEMPSRRGHARRVRPSP
jgi:hypothetical protein